MKVLGIDPGLQFTGWAILESYNSSLRVLESGVITTRKENTSKRLYFIYEKLKDIIESNQPSVVSLEEIFINKDLKGSLKLGYARAISLMVPSIFDLEVYEYAPNTIKKTVVGNGHASKEQVAKMINFIIPEVKEVKKDALDAIAIALCHIHHKIL